MVFVHVLAVLSFGASLVVPVAFTAGAAKSASSVLVANPNVVKADGASAVVLTLTARDGQNNIIPGLSVSFTASGTGNNFGAQSTTTDANGRATTTLTSTVAQNETIIANFDSSATASADVVFVAGPASAATSSLVVNPNSTVANNSNTLKAVLTLCDAQGNPIAGAVPAFSASGLSTTVTASGNTVASGQASANYQTPVAQNQNAMVTAAGITLTAPMAFVAGPATVAASTLTASPNIVAGNGTASMSLLTTARDAQGNPVSNASVSLSASGGNNIFGSVNGTTLGDGTYTTSLKSTKMQTETITAAIAGSVYETVSVTFTGNANATKSTLAVSPNTQTVGPNYSITATLTLRDAASNPVSGVTPSWTGSGQNNTIISSGATSSSGVGTATYSSTFAQNENIKVNASGFGIAGLYKPITFMADSPNATTSYMYANPVRQVANNNNTIVASVMLLDAYGNAVSGQAVSFTASGINTTVSGPSATSSTGLAQATYKTSTIQNQNAVGTAAGLAFSTPIIFTDVPSQCSLTTNPNTQAADGNNAINITASVTNSSGQSVPGVQVLFSSTGAAQNFFPKKVITTSSGQATTRLSSLYAGKNTLWAQAGNANCEIQVEFLQRQPYCTGNPNYSTATYATGANPVVVATADLNNDGVLDLISINNTGNTVSVLLGTGMGTFLNSNNYISGSNPGSFVISDFNSDGVQDLVIVSDDSGKFYVLLGVNTGGFRSPVTYTISTHLYDLTSADFNEDGAQDIAVIDNSSNSLIVFLNTGSGTFQTTMSYATGSRPYSITTGDFDGDGKADLSVVNSADNNVGVFLGTGTGSFQTQVTYAVSGSPGYLATGDFDGDGIQDLAIIMSQLSGSMDILRGTGAGVFQKTATLATGAFPQDVLISDFNGDGVQDVAVANSGDDNIGLFLGTNAEQFQNQLVYPTGQRPDCTTAGDFNGDGKQDFAAVNAADNSVQVFLSTCP